MEIKRISPIIGVSTSMKQREHQNPNSQKQKENKNNDQKSFSEILKKEIEKTGNK